ncbi:MAG: cupin domain-containing protein [Verrucomicrobiales bacterium]|nr:cupin domain-containing protein [Verrucomicrobiales bacterium]
MSFSPIDDDIQDLGFAHSKGHTTPIEVIRLSELRKRRIDGVDIAAPTRHRFHFLKFVTEGRGAHWVDFTRHPVSAGNVVQVRPGQVHAFDADSDPEALLLVFRPEAATPEQIRRIAVHLTEATLRRAHHSRSQTETRSAMRPSKKSPSIQGSVKRRIS